MKEKIKEDMNGNMKNSVDWNLIGKIRRAPTMQEIFLLLALGSSCASDVALMLNLKRSSVSNYFSKLKKLGVIEPYTDLPNYQIYGLTEKGREIAKYV